MAYSQVSGRGIALTLRRAYASRSGRGLVLTLGASDTIAGVLAGLDGDTGQVVAYAPAQTTLSMAGLDADFGQIYAKSGWMAALSGLDGDAGAIAARVVTRAAIAGTDGDVGAFAGSYDVQVPRPISASLSMPWSGAAPRQHLALLPYLRPPLKREVSAMPWARSLARRADFVAAWSRAGAQALAASMPWSGRQPRLTADWSTPWQVPADLLVAASAAWGRATPSGAALAVPWTRPPLHAAAESTPWRWTSAISTRLALPARVLSSTVRGPSRTRAASMPWGWGRPMRWTLILAKAGISNQPVAPEPVQPGTGRQISIAFSGAYRERSGRGLRLVFGGQYLNDVGSLIVTTACSVSRLSDGVAIAASSVQLSLNHSDWSWSGSFGLADPADAALLAPDADGPQSVLIVLNGYAWTLLVESHAVQETHGRRQVSISGRSRAALLSADYATPTDKLFGEARMASQIAAEWLDGTGWELSWEAQDWLIPGGVAAFENQAPIDAIATLAAAIGASVRPDPRYDRLVVSPRYRELPWQWSSAAADAVLGRDVTTEQGIRWESQPAYNAVVVSGTVAGNVVSAKRTGSAGNIVATMVADALLTEPAANTERARQVLSAGGRKHRVSRALPLLPAALDTPGLLVPGLLVDVGDEPSAWVGMVDSVSIATEGSPPTKITQTVELERHIE